MAHTAIHDPLHIFNFRELPLTQLPVNNTINTLQDKAGKSSRGGNCPLFRLFAFSISLSVIRFSAISNLWGEGNRTSRSDDFMYFKESTVRKPLLSSSPARRSSSSPLALQLSKLVRIENFISRKKDNKPRLNSILLHRNNEATKVFWYLYLMFPRNIYTKKK